VGKVSTINIGFLSSKISLFGYGLEPLSVVLEMNYLVRIRETLEDNCQKIEYKLKVFAFQ
jgi:hypothetical protein